MIHRMNIEMISHFHVACSEAPQKIPRLFFFFFSPKRFCRISKDEPTNIFHNLLCEAGLKTAGDTKRTKQREIRY